MSARSQHSPLTIALAALTALGALLFVLTLSPTLMAAPDIAALRAPADAAVPQIERPAFDRYAVIAEQPLFAVDRRTEDAVAASGRPVLSDYRLAGVIVSSDMRLALVERLTSHQVVTLHPGDDLDGRHVEDISTDGVALRDARGVVTLSIAKFKGGGWHLVGDQPTKP